jgi:LmbE family N-acetylglucosaminyl deacetylase
MLKISEIIPEKNLVFISPHYDDVGLTWGGYLQSLVQSGEIKFKKIRIIHLFSRSNYQARDDMGNKDFSEKRIQFATGVRLIEEFNYLDDVLGRGNYQYELKCELECVARGKVWHDGEKFEFPHGNRSMFDDEDWKIFRRFKQWLPALLSESDTAVLLQLGVKEHVDHILFREALVETYRELGKVAASSVYFGEDQPYTGLASRADWEKANQFIEQLGLQERDYAIDAELKADKVMKFYPSQVEESYREGVLNRAKELNGMERIYRWRGNI